MNPREGPWLNYLTFFLALYQMDWSQAYKRQTPNIFLMTELTIDQFCTAESFTSDRLYLSSNAAMCTSDTSIIIRWFPIAFLKAKYEST